MKKIYDTPNVEITVFDSTEITNAATASVLTTPKKVTSVQSVTAIDF